jgi:FAD/FMN-containing dehydrogenase
MTLKAPSKADISALSKIVGTANALTEATDQARYLSEWRGRYFGRTPVVLRASSTEEVSALLAYCNKKRIAVVPQGGNTGLVGGQIPNEAGTEVVLSLERLNKIRMLDSTASCITVEAGVTLAAVQAAADAAGRLFPLTIASEGSCQIGGNLATNAGGTGVLAYGSARSQVLGLEAVLADGRVWSNLSGLKKDNTGYDVRDLLIGSEGTLGIITAATLRLVAKPTEIATALITFDSLDDVAAVFRLVEARLGPSLTAFEFMSAQALAFAMKHGAKKNLPFKKPAPWTVLLDVSAHEVGRAQPSLEAALDAALSDGIATNALIAETLSHAKTLWDLRESLSEAQKPEGGSIKHDVSVPIAAIPDFVRSADALIERICPGARTVPFGHFGDGNVHYNVSQPVGADKAAFLARWDEISHAVHALVLERGGSISAEHGIGRMKRDELATIKSSTELQVMRAIKAAFDPNGILNPGKLL